MKNKLFFLISVLLISLNNAKAMEKEEIDYFQKTPKMLIIEIGSYLYGEDFVNFSLSSKRTKNYLLNNKNLFFPENEEAAIKTIQETPCEKLDLLTQKWSRTKKSKLVNFLKTTSQKFSDHQYCRPMSSSEYEQKMLNFGMDLKCKAMLFFLKDPQNETDFVQIKGEKIQTYYYDDGQFTGHTETLKLMILQGIIVSEKLFQDFKKNSSSEVGKEYRNEILNRQKRFSPIRIIFTSFKAPIEEHI